MEIQLHDILQMKKPHPCGESCFLVTRTGMDWKLVCQGCGHEIMAPRFRLEKNVKAVFRGGNRVWPETR